MTTTTYYRTWPDDTCYRSTGVALYEAWIDGAWTWVLLSEMDRDHLRPITEAEARGRCEAQG